MICILMLETNPNFSLSKKQASVSRRLHCIFDSPGLQFSPKQSHSKTSCFSALAFFVLPQGISPRFSSGS